MSTKEFTLTRTFNASQELVWKAWTDPSLFSRWFGPTGFYAKVHTLDLRPGGVLHSALTNADGSEVWAKFVYREVTPPSRLVWEHSFSNPQGEITRHPGHALWPLRLLTTVVVETVEERTKITLTWVPLDASEEERKTFEENMQSMTQGWTGTFDQLDAFLSTFKANSAIQPYLFFGGRCEEALEFYASAVGAKVETIMLFKESPEPTPPGMLPPGFENKVMHASFRIKGASIMASDGCNEGASFDGFSLSLSLSMSEIDEMFTRLSEGGTVQMPLTPTFWSPRFGMLTDKFGIKWMLMVPAEFA